jgi:hypothetical protein
LLEDFMFRHHMLSLFGAGLAAVLAACHPSTPVQSASSASAAVQCADASAAPSSGEARGAVGFAPVNATPAPCLSATSAKPAADAPSGDEPIWRLDMP